MFFKLSKSELLPNEIPVSGRPANAVVKLSEYGLSNLAFDKYMWIVGMRGKEALGGWLHLTNYRIVFKSHPINRLKGKFSIFLPTITTIRDSSFLWTRKVSITTKLTEFEFVIWGISSFIKAVQDARAALAQENVDRIGAYAVQHYESCGEGLQIFGGIEALNRVFLAGGKVKELVDLATNPLEALGAIALGELFDKGVSEPWQRHFN